jgi:hypothetical protein
MDSWPLVLFGYTLMITTSHADVSPGCHRRTISTGLCVGRRCVDKFGMHDICRDGAPGMELARVRVCRQELECMGLL